MYGIILDSMTDCIKQLYGEEAWKRVVGSADISNTVFTTHKIYDEQLIPMIAKALSEITGNDINTIMEQAGRHFIVYIDDTKNDRIAKVLGRTFKDFLNGLDCMHEYYRFSFPELQPPSFFVADEDAEGMELHYRTKRTFTGFMYYVRGILYDIAKKFFNLDIDVNITQHGFSGDVLCAVFRLNFRNDEYSRIQDLIQAKRMFRERNNLRFPSNVLFELFPFHVVFDETLAILSTGNGLDLLYTGLEGKRINETFFLTRPLGYDLTWENVLIHGNNVFELTSVKAAGRRGKTDDTSRFRHQMAATHFIKLRGQMLYVEEWKFVIFLATFMLDDLNSMYEMGIYVNDLTFHDLSRDMVLHGPQQTTEYKLALDLEQGKTARLEEMIETLDAERRKTDDLLYSRIPKEIARSLRQGNTAVSLCEKHNDVTVLFSDIVNFANICAHIAPHEIMIILNMMVSVFDILCDKFDIYKVETVADGFMAVSGVPTYNEHHAKNMADMAFEMLNGIKTVKDPNTRASIHIRIGLHCGYVVAGLVGHKIPRYCLFGDTVNIASKMEATGEGQRIQISQTCMENLAKYGNKYDVENKGSVKIKGCGNIMTYWLSGVNQTTDGEADVGNKDKQRRKQMIEEEEEVEVVEELEAMEKELDSEKVYEEQEIKEEGEEEEPGTRRISIAVTTEEEKESKQEPIPEEVTSTVSCEIVEAEIQVEDDTEVVEEMASEDVKPISPELKPKDPQKKKSADNAYTNLLRVIDKFDGQSNTSSNENGVDTTDENFGAQTLTVEKEVMENLLGTSVAPKTECNIPNISVIPEIEKAADVVGKGEEEMSCGFSSYISNESGHSTYWQSHHAVGSFDRGSLNPSPSIFVSMCSPADGLRQRASQNQLQIPKRQMNKSKKNVVTSPKSLINPAVPRPRPFISPVTKRNVCRFSTTPGTIRSPRQRFETPVSMQLSKSSEVKEKPHKTKANAFDKPPCTTQRPVRIERKQVKPEEKRQPSLEQISKTCSLM